MYVSLKLVEILKDKVCMPGTYNALRILFEEILKMSDKENNERKNG
jgi:hypothetical protein